MSGQAPQTSPEILEAWAIKWSNKYTMQEIAKEYGVTVRRVRTGIRHYVHVLIACNEKLEQRNQELWRKCED